MWTINWRGKSRHEETSLEAVAEVWVKRDSDFDIVGVLETEKKDGNEVYFGEKIDSTC